MALFISIRDKPYFACLALALAKLYSNSLLAILNSRIRIEGVHVTSSTQMAPGSGIAFAGQNTTDRRLDLPYANAGTIGRIVDNTVPHTVDVRVHRCTETWPVPDDSDMIPMSDMVISRLVFFAGVLITVARNRGTRIQPRARLEYSELTVRIFLCHKSTLQASSAMIDL